MKTTLKTAKDFSTGGLVWDPKKKKLLLIRVENLSGEKVWTFPKGHPEKEETPEEAAVREVVEETGWQCSVLAPVTEVRYFYVHNRTRFDKTVRWFLMEPISQVGEFDPEEVLEVRWVSRADAEKLISYKSDKDLLKQTALLL